MNEFPSTISSREEAEKALNSGDPDQINLALAQMIYFEKEWTWLEKQYMRFVGHPEPDVRALAAIKLGDLARFHRKSSKSILKALRKLLSDPVPIVAGSAQEAIDEIQFHVPDWANLE